MVILLHVTLALCSMVLATSNYIQPTNFKNRVSLGSILATLASGVYLVFSVRSNMLSACVSGLLYVSLVSVLSVAAHKKLHAQQTLQQNK